MNLFKGQELIVRDWHDDKSKYGTHYNESEVVLGATLQDIDYVIESLKDMTTVELSAFRKTLLVIYTMTSEILDEKEEGSGILLNALNSELDAILTATKNT